MAIKCGDIFENKKGESYKIYKILGKSKFIIKFITSGIERTVYYSSILRKCIKNENYEGIKYKIGDCFTTNAGCMFKIIEYISVTKRKIVFLDEFNYEKIIDVRAIKNGNILNPYHKSVCGMGYIGSDNNDGINKEAHNIWTGMINRCYNAKGLSYKTYGGNGVTVCQEWHNFTNFSKWYVNNYPINLGDEKFELDKDLLQVNIPNKVYSPETCILLPQRVNGFYTNIKKTNTSGYIGVTFSKKYNKYECKIKEFCSGNRLWFGYFAYPEDAYNVYVEIRNKNIDDVILYLRNMKYLSENIINKIEQTKLSKVNSNFWCKNDG